MALGPKKGDKPDPNDKRALSDEAFLREVDDAVRASDTEAFFTKYGRWLLVLVGAVILGLGGYTWWSGEQQKELGGKGENFVDAIDKLEAGDEEGARKIFADLKKSDSLGYIAASEFVEANLAMDAGKEKEAIAAYGKIAANTKYPDLFRNFALIRQTTAELDTIKPETVIERMKPLAKPGNPWYGSAGELTAIAYMKLGKEDLAGNIFAEISKQEELPQTLRGRARQMAGSLGVDAVQLDEKEENASSNNESNGED